MAPHDRLSFLLEIVNFVRGNLNILRGVSTGLIIISVISRKTVNCVISVCFSAFSSISTLPVSFLTVLASCSSYFLSSVAWTLSCSVPTSLFWEVVSSISRSAGRARVNITSLLSKHMSLLDILLTYSWTPLIFLASLSLIALTSSHFFHGDDVVLIVLIAQGKEGLTQLQVSVPEYLHLWPIFIPL